MKSLTVKKSFNEIAAKSFDTESQSIDFSQREKSSAKINKWVEDKTDHRIKNMISANSFDEDTQMLLVNAIYFKGDWVRPFDCSNTHLAPFYLNDEDYVQVDFMTVTKKFKFGAISQLNAVAIELPFKNSDISMLIILPNSRTGLSALEQEIKNVDLRKISNSLKSKRKIEIHIPKFKVELDIQLNELLQKVS
jgi:serpin B